MPPAIPTPESITPEFFTDVLRAGGHPGVRVAGFEAVNVGTGQIGRCVRFRLAYAGEAAGAPATLVGKFPSLDPLSSQTGVQLRNYAREVFFYRELAARIPIAKPRCYWAEILGEGPEFALILEDMAPATQGDQLAGCTPEVARAAVCELAKLHAASWMDASLRGHALLAEPSAAGAVQARELYAADAARVPGALRAATRARRARDHRRGREVERPAARLPRRAVGARAHRLSARQPADRRAQLAAAHLGRRLAEPRARLAALRRRLFPRRFAAARDAGARSSASSCALTTTCLCARGVRDYAFEQCWSDYRRGAFAGFAVTVIASVIVQETARGNDMFTAMASRHARHALDLGSAEFLA